MGAGTDVCGRKSRSGLTNMESCDKASAGSTKKKTIAIAVSVATNSRFLPRMQ